MIAFRVDSSRSIGTGHVIRCLTLATELRKRGQQVLFVCHSLKGDMTGFLKSKGMAVKKLKGDAQPLLNWEDGRWGSRHLEADSAETIASLACLGNIDWLIADQYSLDFAWEGRMRTVARKIMVIDDLADRRHDCDILLDQNLHDDMDERYKGLLRDDCRILLGPRYALLRPEFSACSPETGPTGEKRIFIFFGGVDSTNETSKALEAIIALQMNIRVAVVVGSSNPHKNSIKKLCSKLEKVTLQIQSDRMASLMSKADIAVGASGVTAWERCCMGLPSIVIAVAENQVEIAESLSKRGSIVYLGKSENVRASDIKESIEQLLNDGKKMRRMSSASKRLIDGKGVVRVADQLSRREALI